ncbi:MAG: hypothetical protein Q8O67_22150 [Deltaproteobacteria bacterium]|nr:hypothetical protein [Deltaproteobacteria bacterium]
MAGDFARSEVERYLRIHRNGKGAFSAIVVVGAVVGSIFAWGVGFSSSAAAFCFGTVPGGLAGLGVAVVVDNIRRRARLNMTGDQIKLLDQALMDCGHTESEIDDGVINRVHARVNR